MGAVEGEEGGEEREDECEGDLEVDWGVSGCSGSARDWIEMEGDCTRSSRSEIINTLRTCFRWAPAIAMVLAGAGVRQSN